MVEERSPISSLKAKGFKTFGKIAQAKPQELQKITGLPLATVERMIAAAQQQVKGDKKELSAIAKKKDVMEQPRKVTMPVKLAAPKIKQVDEPEVMSWLEGMMQVPGFKQKVIKHLVRSLAD